jgi:FkbM family methyltransferase
VSAPATEELDDVVRWLREPGRPDSGVVDVAGLALEYRRPRPFALALDLVLGAGVYDVDLPPRPRILDGGAWLGLSLLHLRRRHPGARITGYEPDPDLHALCLRNLRRNGAEDVEVVPAALAAADGTAAFSATGSDNGSLTADVRGSTSRTVRTVGARRALGDGADLLKLNVEGAEAAVLRALGPRLSSVGRVVLEYHGFAELPQTLHGILADLDAAGHRYVVSHIDSRNRACVPPLRVGPDLRYFLLVASRRLDPTPGSRR